MFVYNIWKILCGYSGMNEETGPNTVYVWSFSD